MVDIDTLLPERACRETSWFVAFDPAVPPLPKMWVRSIEQAQALVFVSASGVHKPPSRHTFVQALGTAPTLTFHVEVMRGHWWWG